MRLQELRFAPLGRERATAARVALDEALIRTAGRVVRSRMLRLRIELAVAVVFAIGCATAFAMAA